MKLRLFVSFLVAVTVGVLPLALMWLEGIDFARGVRLRDSVAYGLLMFICSGIICFIAPVWSSDK
jgi:hypothetical protein